MKKINNNLSFEVQQYADGKMIVLKHFQHKEQIKFTEETFNKLIEAMKKATIKLMRNER